MFKFLLSFFKRKINFGSIYYIANGNEILPEKLDADREYELVNEMSLLKEILDFLFIPHKSLTTLA